MGARAGCTLVELVVALVLCSIGLLAMLGASTLLVRELYVERAESEALALAQARIATLATTPCARRVSGEAVHPRGVHERWQVWESAPGVHLVADTVRTPAPGGPRIVALQGAAAC